VTTPQETYGSENGGHTVAASSTVPLTQQALSS
jgi:hypothetical protein